MLISPEENLDSFYRIVNHLIETNAKKGLEKGLEPSYSVPCLEFEDIKKLNKKRKKESKKLAKKYNLTVVFEIHDNCNNVVKNATLKSDYLTATIYVK